MANRFTLNWLTRKWKTTKSLKSQRLSPSLVMDKLLALRLVHRQHLRLHQYPQLLYQPIGLWMRANQRLPFAFDWPTAQRWLGNLTTTTLSFISELLSNRTSSEEVLCVPLKANPFMFRSKPQAKDYDLLTAFPPPKVLEHNLTLKDAGLINAAITQRLR